MHTQRFPAAANGERRLIHRGKIGEIGKHLQGYVHDIYQTYVVAGWEESDPIKMATGVIMVPASMILEGTDQLYSAVVGQEYVRPEGIAGRTRRDIKLLLKDVVTLHPLRALGDGFRVVTADWMLDGGDLLGGHRQQVGGTRSAVHRKIEQAIEQKAPRHPSAQTRPSAAAVTANDGSFVLSA